MYNINSKDVLFNFSDTMSPSTSTISPNFTIIYRGLTADQENLLGK